MNSSATENITVNRGTRWLQASFLVGVAADAVAAVNWFLIAGGFAIPNLLSGFVGEGEHFRHAMYIAASPFA